MPEDLVTMRHPEVHLDPDIPSSVMPREVFEAVWAPKGWVEVKAGDDVADAPPAPAPAAPAPVGARFTAPSVPGGESA